MAWALALILLPLIVLLNLTESKSHKVRRARHSGMTWKAIGARYGVSPTTARRWATA
jgi:hypothetical protein